MHDFARGAFTADFPWPAPAKLNLFLHIIGRRADGYHELQTIFQFLDYGDSLFFVPRGDGAILRVGEVAGVPLADDLALRAARRLQRASGCGLGAEIRIDKRLPIGAGLGGGSSNAATTLVALNRLWNLGFTVDELAEIGLGLGADVPVFVRGRAAWAEGVGQRLTPMEPPERWYLVVTPKLSVPTAEIYAAPELKRDCAPLAPAAEPAGAVNVFEPVTCARYPEVGRALAWLRQHGDARMSGTGASVFLTCETREPATALAAQVPETWSRFVARGCNRSPLRAAADR